MSTCKDRLLYKDEFGDIHTVDKINGKRIGDKAVKSKLFDYEQEEADGKLIHLPCKVGDKVYHIYENNVEEDTVHSIYVDCWNNLSIKLRWQRKRTELEDIGKTVFLTKEEAEKALKERNNNDT